MDNKTGIKAKKVPLLDRKVKTDFKKIFTTLSKTAIMGYTGQYTSATKEFASIAEAFELSTDTSDLAYQLIRNALLNAAHALALENRHNFVARLEDAEKLYDDPEYVQFLEGITELMEDKKIFLEYEHLEKPRTTPILKDFQDYFRKFLVLFGLSEKDAELISNRLPTYFVFELNDEWRNNYTKYEKLLHGLNAPTAGAARKARQWEAYNTYLEREVEMPVFGESFGLKDIFIPLRAYYKTKYIDEDKKEVVSLEVLLDEWLMASEVEDPIKVIQGGPGSGKSSFAKCWTAKIAKNKTVPILFFPLHHFNIHTSIQAAIGEYFKDAVNIPLEFNPLDDKPIPDKMLLVFDGLDELVMQGKSSKETADAFMQELKDFCSLKNEGKQRIRVLVTGRPIAIQNTEAKLRSGAQQILFLLPYHLKADQRLEYEDVNKLLKEDQRNSWWNRFFDFKELSNVNLPVELRNDNMDKITTEPFLPVELRNDNMDKITTEPFLPVELRNDNMDKITTEPLLNYLVALSWKDAPEKFTEDTNINEVYEQLMLGVYQRDWDKKKHQGTGDLTLDQFIQILEEIAICAWQGGDARVTTERKIEKHIKKMGLDKLLKEYTNANKRDISSLLTAFYFRKHGTDSEYINDTFEFTHKSFGEYLAARAIVKLIQTTYTKIKEKKDRTSLGWTIPQTLREWLRITGKNILDNDLKQFIVNEIKIRKKAGEPIEQWQNTLCEVISELIHDGMPLHPQKQINRLEEIRIARNAEEAILVALSSCALVTNKISVLDWGKENWEFQVNRWLNRLSTSLSNQDFAFMNLNHLDLSKANLIDVKLTKVDLTCSKLTDTNLEMAILAGVNLKSGNLTNANLTDADLQRANLASGLSIIKRGVKCVYLC